MYSVCQQERWGQLRCSLGGLSEAFVALRFCCSLRCVCALNLFEKSVLQTTLLLSHLYRGQLSMVQQHLNNQNQRSCVCPFLEESSGAAGGCSDPVGLERVI